MIKVNVILNNIIWKKYLKNPHRFIDKKIELLNKKNKLYKKNTLICSLLLSGTQEIKKLNKLPGIYSARWGGKHGDFTKAIRKVYVELNKKDKN